MKQATRLLSMALAILMVFALLPQISIPTQAAKTYNLKIAGVPVTDSNKNDILGDGIFSYDSQRNELYVQSIRTIDGQIAIDNGIKGLTVWLSSKLIVKNAECAIKSSANMTIRGDVETSNTIDASQSEFGVCMSGSSTLTIIDSNIRVNAGTTGLCGSETGKEKLVVRRSNLYTSAQQGVTQFSGGITLEDCSLEEGTIQNGTVVREDGSIEKYVEIRNNAEHYGIYIDGFSVNNKNKNDVLEDGGSVKYDPKTQTLTLNDPKFRGKMDYIIDAYVDGLTIRGKAVMDVSTYNPVWMLDSTIINGDFTIVNHSDEGIGAYGDLTFAGGTIQITGMDNGLYFSGPEYTLSFVGGSVTMNGSESAVQSYGKIVMSGGAQIVTPKKGKVINIKGEADEFWAIGDSKGTLSKKATIAVSNPFADVKAGTEYYNAVLWAANHKPYQVTAGLDKTHFGPDQTVTRAQAMTFFWAASNRPKFKKASTQFKDVKKSDWYYKAVMWAVENKITAGTDATHFSPSKTCNRGEILAFFYAAVKKPKVKISNPYKDISNQWFKKAALWAYDQGIEHGEKGKFNASTPCTRASTVTYLYRFMVRQDLELD